MNANQVVDLSADNCNDEVLRKRINRKKMNELRKYIPFLEFISRLDPVKHHNFAKLLKWLKLNTEFPARMADTCERNIITRFNKIKNTTELPAHIVEVFTEKDAIVISDEDEDQQTEKRSAQVSNHFETIDLECDEPIDLAKGTISTTDEKISSVEAEEIDKTRSSSKTKNNIANSQIEFQNPVTYPDNNSINLEEGEILSDGDDIKENKQTQKLNASLPDTLITTPSEDDIINRELFKRIDSFDDENNCKRSQAVVSEEKEEEANMPILRQINLEKELFSRRSPKKTQSDSLSTISSEDTIRLSYLKKKKKKRKHKKKSYNQTDWHVSEVENQSEKGEKVIKTKIYRKETSRKEEKSKKPKKSAKKQNKESKQPRSLYISDDEDDDAVHINRITSKPKLSENLNDLANFNELPTVVLSDSNDEEVNQISSRQEKNIKLCSDSRAEEVEKVPLRSAVITDSNEELRSQENIVCSPNSDVIQDIYSMKLNELNDIYTKLCDATGIQLEELLIDLVGKSTKETQQTQNDLPKTIEEVAQSNFEKYSTMEISNQNMYVNNRQHLEEDPNTFAFQYHQMHYQQNQNQIYQMRSYNIPQQEMQLTLMNEQCHRLPVQPSYQNTLRPGLNLNDPRIVQRLKQIKDSPIHNINIRESATLLMNRHTALAPPRPSLVPKVTARTATTYGEHKRLRELEKRREEERKREEELKREEESKREEERQAGKNFTMTPNQSSRNVHIIEKDQVSSASNICAEKNNETKAQSLIGEVNKENDTDETLNSLCVNKSTSQSLSTLEEKLLPSGKKTKSNDNMASGRITPFEVEKVVNIVLEAIGPINADASKRLKRLSSQLESRRNSYQDDNSRKTPDLVDKPTGYKDIKNVMVMSAKNKDSTTKFERTQSTVKERNSRPNKKILEKPSSKRSSSKMHGIRELNNLNCTFLEYQEIFRNNSIETNGGKRRCIKSLSAMRDDLSSDEDFRFSDDNVQAKKMTAAPISRRRKTCSALNDNPIPRKDKQVPIKVVFRRLSDGGTFGIKNATNLNSVVEAIKQQKQTQNAFHKVKVMVRKLSFDELKMKTNSIKQKTHIRDTSGASENNISSEEPILVPISSVDCLSQTKVQPRPIRHLNDDINMTMNSTKMCTICNKRSLDLTSHYVQQHKTESFVSRLTTAEIEVLEREIKLATLNRKRYRTTCVFCQDELEVHQFVQFHAHFSYHTGEYGYKCNVCEIIKPYREDIKSHQHRRSRCRNGKIRTNYLYQSDLKVIYLYICKLCNFVQLNEANVHKHQREHHSFRFEEPQHVKKCIICALDDTEVINEFLPATEMESSIGEMKNAESNEESLQEIVQEYPLDIKDVLISLENDNNYENSNEGVFPSVSAENEEVVPTFTSTTVSKEQIFELSNNEVTSRQQRELGSSKMEIKERAPQRTTSNSNEHSTEDFSRKDSSTIAEKCSIEIVAFPTHLSPETLVEQLHAVGEARTIMTVIHAEKPLPCVEHHKPYEEKPDIKPTISEIKIEKAEDLDISVPSPPSVKNISYRRVTPGTNYFGLYKCMSSECWFSTNEAEKYIRHVQTHKVNGQQLVLCCAYCSSKHTCAKLSVKHIRTRHSMSCYQCSACTYRSVVSVNVSFHLEMYHKDITDEKCIFKCVGRVRTREDKLAALKEKIKENVNRFICRDCTVQFYSISLMKSHIETTQHNIQASGLLKYACIFCEVNSNSLEEMRFHLVNLHPNEACWVVERELNNPMEKDSIENLKWVNMALPGANGFEIRVADFKEEELEPVETTNKIELDLIERLKPLLELITEKTGVYRADLYKCTFCNGSFFTYELWLNHVRSRHGITNTVTCSYCPLQITLEEVAQHFESHLRHEYICLNCVKTFGSKLELEDHFEANHANFQNTFGRPIVYSNSKKYYIMKGEEEPSEWIPILQRFAEVLRKLCIEKLYENRNSDWCFELGHLCFEDIDIPQFTTGSGNIFQCIVKSCAYEATDENDFILHLNQHTVPHSYDCPYCGKIVETSWECIKHHFMLHRSKAFHICCVCKFVHHNRSVVTDHIKQFHNSRDVPILTLLRDTNRCKVSASIVIPANKMGFVTTTTCFCCGQGMTSGKGVMSHLIDVHGIAVCRKCELCACILLNRREAEEHREKHASADFTIRYDILSSSSTDLSVDSISPFRINLKRPLKKRLSEVEIELPSKRMKLDELSLNIKQEVNKGDGEDVNINNDNNCEKPSCSIKCVNINQLVSSTTNITPGQSTRGLVNIQTIENSLMNSTSAFKYQIETNTTKLIDQCVLPHQIIQESNSKQSTYIPRQQVAPISPQATQLISAQDFSNYNIQCFPPNEHQTEENTNIEHYSNNNVQSMELQRPVFQSVTCSAVYKTLEQQRTPTLQFQHAQHQQTFPLQHESSYATQHSPSVSTQLPLSLAQQCLPTVSIQRPPLFPAQSNPKSIQPRASPPQNNIISATLPNITKQSSSDLPLSSSSYGQRIMPTQQSQNNEDGNAFEKNSLENCYPIAQTMEERLPNNQEKVTVSSDLLTSSMYGQRRMPPGFQLSQNNENDNFLSSQRKGRMNFSSEYANSSHSNTALGSSFQSSDAFVPSGAFQTNSLDNSNQIAQSMEEIANTIDINLPELLPICGNCTLECTSFVMLLSHFHAKHDGQHRFIFRVERRVACGYCKYRGSISSFPKHNNTFHPGQAFLCKSVLDHSRCGVCNGVFNINTLPNRATLQQCSCPIYKRNLSDCLDLDALKMLQKYGKKIVRFLCEICKKVFHSEVDCLSHIRNVHNKLNILPKKCALKDLVFFCYACEKTSASVKDLILHIEEKHPDSTTATSENRFLFYKKIRVVYPRGLMVTLGSLCNAGYSEGCLKRDLETVHATLGNRITNTR